MRQARAVVERRVQAARQAREPVERRVLAAQRVQVRAARLGRPEERQQQPHHRETTGDHCKTLTYSATKARRLEFLRWIPQICSICCAFLRTPAVAIPHRRFIPRR